ncbi:MAG: DUF503 domain-containing protein [Chloroflexi bacterium]|nr:DUF503 domain-containing protein [Chloroflexota bacterium]
MPAMHVGVCRIRLHLPASQSLKDKRQAVKSVVSRVRNSYNVSISEIEDQDLWQLCTLGICCAGPDPSPLEDLLGRIVDFVTTARYDYEVVESQTDVITVF